MQHIKTNLTAFFQANELCLELAAQVNIIYFKYRAYDTEPTDPANVLCDVSENLVTSIQKAFGKAYPKYAFPLDSVEAYNVYDALDAFIHDHCPLDFTDLQLRNF